jgi:hypothetical protein
MLSCIIDFVLSENPIKNWQMQKIGPYKQRCIRFLTFFILAGQSFVQKRARQSL